MIEFYFIIWNRVKAHLTDLPISPHDLQHYITGDSPGVFPPLFSFSERLCCEIYRTQVPENLAGCILDDLV
jgi:hypothetical protein